MSNIIRYYFYQHNIYITLVKEKDELLKGTELMDTDSPPAAAPPSAPPLARQEHVMPPQPPSRQEVVVKPTAPPIEHEQPPTVSY